MTEPNEENRDESERRQRRALVTIILVGAGLRLYALGRESYWIDELYSIGDALRFSTVELVTVLPLLKNHTPVYYILLRHWAHLVGLSETALRLPSALAGVGAIYVTYLVGTELFDGRTGLLAATMGALSSFHINHSQAVRMYSFVALLTAASFYWLLQLRQQYDRRTGAGYVITTALLVYTHPYGLFVILAQNCFVGGLLGWQRFLADIRAGYGAITWRRWGRIQTILGAVLVPYGFVALEKIFSTAAGTYTPLTWRTPPGPIRLVVTLVRYFGVPIWPQFVLLALPLLCLAAVITVVRVDRVAGDRIRDRLSVRFEDRDAAMLTLTWLIVPIAIPAVLSHLLAPVYGIRYTIGASVGLFLLVARAITRLRPRYLQYVIVLLVVAPMVLPLPWYYAETQNEQWREATTHVDERADRGDLVLFTDSDGKRAWTVYGSRSDLTVREVATDRRWAELEGSLSEYETIWVINRTYSATNDNRAAAAVLEDSHRKATERRLVGVHLYRFERLGNRTTSKSAHPTEDPMQRLTGTSVDRTHRLAKRHPQ
jgi:4-amino-4-deoxy-L-arabinose transferase-like glycosyltransferase